jgi:hypothetical protein
LHFSAFQYQYSPSSTSLFAHRYDARPIQMVINIFVNKQRCQNIFDNVATSFTTNFIIKWIFKSSQIVLKSKVLWTPYCGLRTLISAYTINFS